MARVRRDARAGDSEPQRRITATIDGPLFRRTASYRGYSGKSLTEIVTAALQMYLKHQGFSVGATNDPGEESAAA